MSEASIPHLLDLFEYTSADITERFEELRIVLNLSNYKNLDINAIIPATAFLNQRDTLHLSLVVDEGEPIDFYSGGDSLEFTTELESKFSILDDEPVSVTLRIIKNIADGILSIYYYQEFLSYLNSLTVQAIYHEFNTYVQKTGFLVFEFQTAEEDLKSSSIWFVNKGFNGMPVVTDRQTRISKAKSSCHYNFLAKYALIADDFAVPNISLPDMANLMNKLATILSIAFLFDITNLQGNTLEYRLNGYKSINGTADLKLLQADPNGQYYKIYSWVYDSGNFTDKTGLARNIISLHLEQLNNLSLKGEPFTSIQSSYKVYEKQNIKQYIEIRNKISDQLLGFHDRANKIIETFATGFQKSAFALITFYISAVILKVLSKDKLVEVFTIDAATLSTAFILCSIVYYFVLKWEVNAQKLRFENNYKDVKSRYTDLLDEQDINRILNDDHEFKSDLKFVDDKAKNYTIMWFVFLGIFFATTWILYFIYNPALPIKFINWIEHLNPPVATPKR